MKLLTVEKVSVRLPVGRVFFRTHFIEVLKDISFDIHHGESFGIVGESGSGKTTLARVLVRLIDHVDGSVKFLDQELLTLKRHALKKLRPNIQMIFQDPFSSLNPRMTLGKLLEEVLIIHKGGASTAERRHRVHEILDAVSLDAAFYYRYPHELSGGQRQRVSIARALLLKPKLIIADEAVSALDVSIQAQILRLMQKLQKDFTLAYLFISHDLAVVEYLCTRILVLYAGEVMEVGTRKDIVHGARHPYTRVLIASSSFQVGQVSDRGEGKALKGCTFYWRCPRARELCVLERPSLRKLGAQHFVACHFAEEE